MEVTLSTSDDRRGFSRRNASFNRSLRENENAAVFLDVPGERYLSTGNKTQDCFQI